MAERPNGEPTAYYSEGDALDRGLAAAFGPESGRSVLDALGESIGPVPRVMLRDAGEPDAPATRLRSSESPDSGLGRYQVFGEIARGGMGAVLRGRDVDLGRDLAFKVLLDRHRDHPDMVRRFVEEAQIGGQLQHPGIVPVYELGTFADRRPYFAMKLVKGQTLAYLLKGRATAEADRPRLLSIFEQMAQTVAYAHARGVIHRDLKPSNVMVGSFGEVQVMDWGLAKVLTKGGIADDVTAGRLPPQETVIATVRSGGPDSDLSQPGSVLGTPSYMAPEQARGEVEAVDERADVFALGSILCEILTGLPAFTGRSSGEIQRQASRGELTGALDRLAASGSDVELIGLTRDCLAAEPVDRPRDAGAVASRVTAYLAGVQERLRRAEYEKIEERARHRLTTVVAAAVLALVALGGGGWYWVESGRQERRSAAVAALAEARLLGEQARRAGSDEPKRWVEAAAAAKHAEGMLAGAGAPALQDEVVALREQIEAGRRDAEAEQKLLASFQSIGGEYSDDLDGGRADQACVVAFRTFGLDLDAMAPRDVAARLSGRRSTPEIASALDMWCRLRRHELRVPTWTNLAAVVRLADPDPWRNALRDEYGRPVEQALPRLQAKAADIESLKKQPALSLLLLFMMLRDAADLSGARGVLYLAGRQYPSDFWVRYEQGKLNLLGNSPAEAARYFNAAAAIRPQSPAVHVGLGDALAAMNQSEEAIAEFREAIRLQPGGFRGHLSLGVALHHLKRTAEGIAELRESVRLRPDSHWAHHNLGLVHRDTGDVEGAVAEFREAIKLDANLVADASGHLGWLLVAQKRLDEAITVWRTVLERHPNYVPTYDNLRVAYLTANPPRFEQFRAEWERLLQRNPSNHGAWFGYAELCLFLRNEKAYARARSALLARFGTTTDPSVAERTSRASLLAPAAGDDLKRATALADRALAAGPANPFYNWYQFAKGLADYRANQLDKTTQLLQETATKDVGPESLLLLAMIQHREGHATEARRTLRRALASYDWTESSAIEHRAWIIHSLRREAQGLIVPDLTACLRKEYQPVDNTERLLLIAICRADGLHAAEADLALAAFNADPTLVENLRSFHRYDAACSAALAGCGRGRDDPRPDEARRAELRGRALAWLKADLKACSKRLPNDIMAAANIRRFLGDWRSDSTLAGVRDPAALASLPEAERTEWQAFWAELERLLPKQNGTR